MAPGKLRRTISNTNLLILAIEEWEEALDQFRFESDQVWTRRFAYIPWSSFGFLKRAWRCAVLVIRDETTAAGDGV